MIIRFNIRNLNRSIDVETTDTVSQVKKKIESLMIEDNIYSDVAEFNIVIRNKLLKDDETLIHLDNYDPDLDEDEGVRIVVMLKNIDNADAAQSTIQTNLQSEEKSNCLIMQ